MTGGPAARDPADWRAEVERIVREFLVLRRREVELLERLEASFAGSSRADAGVSPPEDRSWLDEAVDAALRRAFSGVPDSEGEEHEEKTGAEEATDAEGDRAAAAHASATPAPTAPPAVAALESGPVGSEAPLPPRLDPDLLLLQSGDIHAAFPWDQVQEIGLAEEVADGPAGSSLQEYLNGGSAGARADEPYRISWKTPDGIAALTCAALGAVVPASVAASRGVELVLLPQTRAGASPCRVLTLVDFLATLSSPVAPEIPATLAVAPPSDSPCAPPTEPVGESSHAPPGPPIPEPSAPPAEAVVEAGSGPRGEEPVVEPALLPEKEPARFQRIAEPSAPPSTAPPQSEAAPRVEYPRGPALVAVRYLPARVAISRVLRSLGWQAVQAPDNQELPAILRQGQYEIILAEPPDPIDRSWLDALARLRGAGGRVIVVASRMRGGAHDPLRALGDVPRLLHPFREGDIQRALRLLFGTAG